MSKNNSRIELADKINNMLSKLSEKDTVNKDEYTKHLKDCVNFLNSKSIKTIFMSFLEDIDKDNNIDKDDILLLGVLLKLCNFVYNFSGEDTGITDGEYDVLVEYYRDHSTNDIITEALPGTSDVVHHKYKTLRGTLDKIYKITDEDILKNKSQKSLDDWVTKSEKKYEEITGKKIDLYEEEVYVMPKFDGVSCIFEFDKNGELVRALTRGDTSTNEAQDITHIFKGFVKGNPAEHEYGRKTEIMMLDKDLDLYNNESTKKYKNTRSIVSSILNSDEADSRVNYLKIIPLRMSYYIDGEESEQYLDDGVFNYPFLKCKLKELDKIHEFAFSHRTVHPGLRCDGAVIYIINKDIQRVLGREGEKQKYEVAFKFTEEVAYSEVKDVEFTTGLFGKINPVAIVKPVKMKGNSVSRASLGSYARFKDLELSEGDVVKVLYDIIPYVIYDCNDPFCSRSGKKPFEAPIRCVDCNSLLELSETGDSLFCVNEECPSRIKGKILNYVKKLGISNISYATIDDFYREGLLRSIQDLYTLKEHVEEISKLPLYGEKKINKIIEEIENHMEITEDVLLASLGIKDMSTKTFKKLLSFVHFDEIIELCEAGNVDFFSILPGIKTKKAIKLVEGIKANIDLINFLNETLTVKLSSNGPILFKAVFTKVRDDDLEKYIEDHGGSVEDNVTKDCSFVIVPKMGVESGSTEKAKKYNIPIIAMNDVKKYIDTNF